MGSRLNTHACQNLTNLILHLPVYFELNDYQIVQHYFFDMPFDHEFNDNVHLSDLFQNNLTLANFLCFNSVKVSDSSVSKNSVKLFLIKSDFARKTFTLRT